MSPATFNSFANDSEMDFDIQDSYTLDDALSMVEFQESLIVEEDVLEEMIFEEEV